MSEQNPWLMTPQEEAAWLARIRQENDTPESRQRDANRKKMAALLMNMLLPLIPAEAPAVTSPPSARKAPAHDALAELAGDVRGQDRLLHALNRYACASGEASLGVYHRVLIQQLAFAARKLHKLGATLYLLQQLYDRRLHPEPGISKAQTLFAIAPLHEDDPLLEREAPDKITAVWRRYSCVASNWAAFVVLTKSPLDYQPELLHDFLQADPVEAERLTEQFAAFRHRFRPVRTHMGKSPTSYIKRGLGKLPPPTQHDPLYTEPALDIPNLLADYQWQALHQYSSTPNAVAKIRAKKERAQSPSP
ncbi:hypothetical protein RY831_29445 [Noviherbaspirillum sp. CPCC 100848]|uniref:Uncharacterized protein n=1 Tax=Noviherbaspirillum album TaxID=3080276 RepID=A0ABU6JI07_9BURK|nr:hypothetical protein [Noviherbaspirillum sp. CPCC 100848]MEC4723286.1 hypothetical protein [Noviherbaspirillum sp. CPCC 100848]